MRTLPAAATLIVLTACTGPAAPAPLESPIRNAEGADVGRVSLAARGDEIQIHLQVSGLAPGQHGVHLHAAADCQGPAFQSAMGHLNPDRRKHGRLNPEGAHLGDLGNLSVGASGRVERTISIRPTGGGGVRELLGQAGVALVIHAERDDEATDPSGNSGARVACAALK
ncbi:MAG: superoxide dismutase family protein [Gemmatimonadales bacterium]|nr:superoxide dismutase family protein [Gemmatimonadales bacterium]